MSVFQWCAKRVSMVRLQTRKQSNTTHRFHPIPDTDKGRGVRAPALRSCYGQPVPILQNHFLNAKISRNQEALVA